jgi:hypothetical protein
VDDATPENWLPIDGYEGSYEISDLGRVRSLPRVTTSGRHVRGCILKPQTHKACGHLEVSLYGLVEKGRSYWIHQLVMEAFAGPPQPGQEVRHLDGNPANNRWAPGSTEKEVRAAGGNLFYGTRKENVADGIRHGTMWQVMSRETPCRHGHEYTAENTSACKSGSGRSCRACGRDRSRAQCLARREGITYQEALVIVRSAVERASDSQAKQQREAASECELAGRLF